MGYPKAFITPNNFKLAFERIVRSGNQEYKQFYRPLLRSYALALDNNVAELVHLIRTDRYRPSRSQIVYQPKKSGVLRPISVLSLDDLIVYQGMVNVIANEFEPEQKKFALRRTFGSVYAGPSSHFFFRSWKSSYRAYRKAVEAAYSEGRHWVADFDLVSFFELIDHNLLAETIGKKIKNSEFLQLLKMCLGRWSLGDGFRRIEHGVPQGPEGSAFLAECILFSVDREAFKNCVTVRYVDDIKLLSRSEVGVRRALVKLDLLSKDLGLVPQAQKIECREVKNVKEILKTLPSGLVSSVTRPTRIALTRKRRDDLVSARAPRARRSNWALPATYRPVAGSRAGIGRAVRAVGDSPQSGRRGTVPGRRGAAGAEFPRLVGGASDRRCRHFLGRTAR